MVAWPAPRARLARLARRGTEDLDAVEVEQAQGLGGHGSDVAAGLHPTLLQDVEAGSRRIPSFPRRRLPVPVPVPVPVPESSSMNAFGHDNLEVYRAAIELADEVVEHLPRGRGYLADQLQRAAMSVALNIAEARVSLLLRMVRSVDSGTGTGTGTGTT